MSLLDPPSFAQRKRKRSLTTSAPPSHLPQETINPRSHSPGTIYQFAAAGLSQTDEDPSETIPDFPHRGLGGRLKARHGEPDSDWGLDESEPDGGESAEKKPKGSNQPKGHFQVLLQSVHQFLDQGQIEKAARAYGLLLQLPTLSGKPVDVRHHSLWAIGAEIIMREGEDLPINNRNSAAKTPRRWGRAANMNKLQAYLNTLIQQYPYDYKHTRSVAAPDFWLALLTCEVYNTHTEHGLALDRLDAQDWDEDEEEVSYESLEGFKQANGDRDDRAKLWREDLRVQALATMREITRSMDGLMQDQPYVKDRHFLRLRAMASLYMADLMVPQVDVLPMHLEEARRQRLMEQHTAKLSLSKILENGGELDDAAMAILSPKDGDEDQDDQDSTLSLYSSLPIRGL